MTHNTQGGIARWVKHLGKKVTFGYEGHKKEGVIEGYHPTWGVVLFVPTNIMVPYHYVREELIEWPESPLPASPEGTMKDTVSEFVKTAFRLLVGSDDKDKFFDFLHNHPTYVIARKDFIQPLQQENEFKRNMIADLDSMNERLKQDNERLKEELEDSITFSKKAIEIATDEMAKLKSQLAEAREALEQIKTIYDNVEDAAGVIAKKALSALK